MINYRNILDVNFIIWENVLTCTNYVLCITTLILGIYIYNTYYMLYILYYIVLYYIISSIYIFMILYM